MQLCSAVKCGRMKRIMIIWYGRKKLVGTSEIKGNTDHKIAGWTLLSLRLCYNTVIFVPNSFTGDP